MYLYMNTLMPTNTGFYVFPTFCLQLNVMHIWVLWFCTRASKGEWIIDQKWIFHMDGNSEVEILFPKLCWQSRTEVWRWVVTWWPAKPLSLNWKQHEVQKSCESNQTLILLLSLLRGRVSCTFISLVKWFWFVSAPLSFFLPPSFAFFHRDQDWHH